MKKKPKTAWTGFRPSSIERSSFEELGYKSLPEACYRLRERGWRWSVIDTVLSAHGGYSSQAAKRYAKQNSLVNPPVYKEDTGWVEKITGVDPKVGFQQTLDLLKKVRDCDHRYIQRERIEGILYDVCIRCQWCRKKVSDAALS